MFNATLSLVHHLQDTDMWAFGVDARGSKTIATIARLHISPVATLFQMRPCRDSQ